MRWCGYHTRVSKVTDRARSASSIFLGVCWDFAHPSPGRGRDIPTASAAWLSMAAIVYVANEMFRSPVDAATTYLPYLAVVTIAAVALSFLLIRHHVLIPESELEQL